VKGTYGESSKKKGEKRNRIGFGEKNDMVKKKYGKGEARIRCVDERMRTR
jgi:hypothetical protein